MDSAQIDELIKGIIAIDENKLYVIAIITILLIVSYTFRWYLTNKSEKHISDSLNKLGDSINILSDVMIRHEVDSDNRIERLANVMEEIRDRQKNILSKTDSIRIILNKFDDVVKKEVIEIITWSIAHNDYKTRSKFIKTKVKTTLAEILNLTKRSIKEFNLSVEIDKFFVTYINKADGNIHMTMVDQIWDAVEKYYDRDKYNGKSAEILQKQIEEMKVAVDIAITTELNKIQIELNNIYIT